MLGESKPELSFQNFFQTNLNSNSLEELKTKLGEKTLDKLLEQNEDYETEVDTLTRTKNSLEADLSTQSNAFQSRLREKDREIKKLKEDLTNENNRADNTQQKLSSEKQQHKGSLERISKLTEQITNLEKEKQKLASQLKKLPGEFPEETSSIASQTSDHQSQLENFIEWVKDYEEFDKVDWDYYRSQKDWQKSFRTWNKLRTDRISLLDQWKEENK